ncbi:ABC transporter substrate-binding protein [[Brevibacterium] frigoritolerans]|uniref:Thiamine pyrimidine synthase n=1 Tax=Peribacillus frigoritolerans TaxID=450367 RepID=A0A941FK54_9BACI|nr:ABC transporter substrate-binding protein [Peribacillus frigoritolerans]
MFKNKLAFVLLCLVLIVSACGPSDETTTKTKGIQEEKRLSLLLRNLHDYCQFAPLYVAIEQGFFEKEGIEAEIVSGGGGAQVIASVLSGEAQFAVSGPRSMFTPLDKGEDLLAIQSLNSALTYQITLSKQYQKKRMFLKTHHLKIEWLH